MEARKIFIQSLRVHIIQETDVACDIFNANDYIRQFDIVKAVSSIDRSYRLALGAPLSRDRDLHV